MQLLQVSTTRDAIVLDGEIDMAVADEVRDAVLAAASAGTTVVDLSRVTFIDSSGLKALLVAAKSLNGSGPLVLREAPRSVRRLLAMMVPDGAPGLEIAP